MDERICPTGSLVRVEPFTGVTALDVSQAVIVGKPCQNPREAAVERAGVPAHALAGSTSAPAFRMCEVASRQAIHDRNSLREHLTSQRLSGRKAFDGFHQKNSCAR
jgi:hypothetical protein